MRKHIVGIYHFHVGFRHHLPAIGYALAFVGLCVTPLVYYMTRKGEQIIAKRQGGLS